MFLLELLLGKSLFLLLLFDEDLLLALSDELQGSDEALDVHEARDLVTVNGEELVELGFFLELLADGRQLQSQIEVVQLDDLDLAVLLADDLLLDGRSEELTRVHVALEQESRQLLEHLQSLVLEVRVAYQNGVLGLGLSGLPVGFVEALLESEVLLAAIALGRGYVNSWRNVFLLVSLLIISVSDIVILVFVFFSDGRDAEVLHDQDELVEDHGAVELRLGEHLEQALGLQLCDVVEADLADTRQESARADQVQRSAVLERLRLRVLAKGLFYSFTLLMQKISYAHEALLSDVEHALFLRCTG